MVAVDMADEGRRWTEPLKAEGQSGGFFGCAPMMGGGCGEGATGVAIYGTPALDGELVYIGGYNGKIYAYNTETLMDRWVYPRDSYLEPIAGGLAVADGSLYFGCSDGKIYALDAATGDKLWEFQTGDKVWSTPTISNGVVYIGSFDNIIYALSADDGSKLWEYETEGAIISTPLVYNETVYFGSFDRTFYALYASDGTLKWSIAGGNWFWATPVMHNDTIYASCLDNKIYALRSGNGDIIAEIELESPVSSTPVFYGSDIIVASRNGAINKIDTGLNQAEYLSSVDEEVYGPIAINDELIYVHTQDLTLHRINVTTGAVLRSISLEKPEEK
jgi:outer membrane protein assembly factor BamB